jgi:hypothetical protein
MQHERVHDLCLEVSDDATEIVDLLTEFRDALEHRGGGTRRDPAALLRELIEAAADLRGAAREARDEIERESRGLQP